MVASQSQSRQWMLPPVGSLFFDSGLKSNEKLLLMSEIAEARRAIEDWVSRRSTGSFMNSKFRNETIGVLWKEAVIAWYWLNNMPCSRMTFQECCDHLGWDAVRTQKAILSQFNFRHVRSLCGPESIEWILREFGEWCAEKVAKTHITVNGLDIQKTPYITPYEFASRALKRQAEENAADDLAKEQERFRTERVYR